MGGTIKKCELEAVRRNKEMMEYVKRDKRRELESSGGVSSLNRFMGGSGGGVAAAASGAAVDPMPDFEDMYEDENDD